MKFSRSKLALVLLLLPVFLIGCLEGETGPAGPAGTDGAPGEDATSSPFTYQGDKGAACMHCHTGIVATVLATNHTDAFDGLDAASQENLYCLQCHTTGFDSEVSYGATEIAVYGPDTYGYDDYFGVEGDEAADRRMALEGVQCESCHGPMGPDFNAHRPIKTFATRLVDGVSMSMCAKCHQSSDFSQVEEWALSGHANAAGGDWAAFNDEYYANSSSCRGCHTAEGFVWANDAAYADQDFPDEVSFIGCVACHDPHQSGPGDNRSDQVHLRNLGASTVNFWQGFDDDEGDLPPAFAGYGTAQVCAQCHKARRDLDDVTGQIENGSGHFGPHHSNQMDMFIGAGCWEIEGYGYDRGTVHNAEGYMESACVQCHMRSIQSPHGTPEEHSSHSFAPVVANCEQCHDVGSIPEDFDYQSTITDVAALMDDLAAMFPMGPGLGNFADADAFYADEGGWASNLKWDHDADPLTEDVLFYENWQRECGYAMAFIHDDGSHGIHNSTYATSLLENALLYYPLN